MIFNLIYNKIEENRVLDINNIPVPINKYIIIIQVIFIIIIITQIGRMILEEIKKKADKQFDKPGYVILLFVFNMFIFMLFCKKKHIYDNYDSGMHYIRRNIFFCIL